MIKYCVIDEYDNVVATYENFNEAYRLAVEMATDDERIVTIDRYLKGKRTGYWLVNLDGNICGYCVYGKGVWPLILYRSWGLQKRFTLNFVDLHDLINSTAFICDFYDEVEVWKTLHHGTEEYEVVMDRKGIHFLRSVNNRHLF